MEQTRIEPPAGRTGKPPWRACALRADLIVTETRRHGERIAVVKDPIAHRFYEMPGADWTIARELDPGLSLAALLARLRETCPEECGDMSDRALARRVAALCGELRSLGLAAGAGTSRPRPTGRGSLRRVARALSAILFLRVRLFDPETLLQIAGPACSALLRPSSQRLAAGFVVISAAAFFLAGATGSFDPGWLRHPSSWVALYLGIAGLKFFHEMAHAAVVRHYGGRVHEVGMMLVAGLPLFYVEASDSYLFPHKRQRIAVAAAGIAAELLIAALLVWPWLLLTAGFTRDLLLALIVLASLTTILFNANPLMRFDGYYILADALDIPDLRQRSRAYCAAVVRRWLLGGSGQTVTGRRAWIYGSYGVASQLYLVAIIFGLWRFVSVLLEPYGLKWIGHIVVGAWAFGSIVLPLCSFVAGLWRNPEGRKQAAPRRRLVLGTVTAILLAAALLVPIPRAVERSCTLEAVEANAVRTSEAGFVEKILASEGDPVVVGQPVAILRNRALDADWEAAKVHLAQAEARRAAAISGGNGQEFHLMRAEATSARARCDDLERRRNALVLRAPISGTIATRDLTHLVGTRLDTGATFCVIRPSRNGDFLIPLDEKAARLVKQGADVALRTTAFPAIRYAGSVTKDPLSSSPNSLEPGQSSPGTETHYARVQIPDPEGRLRPGMTGRVRIGCGTTTLAAAVAEGVMDFVRLDVRLR